MGDLKMKAGGVRSSIKSSSFHKESLKILEAATSAVLKYYEMPQSNTSFLLFMEECLVQGSRLPVAPPASGGVVRGGKTGEQSSEYIGSEYIDI